MSHWLTHSRVKHSRVRLRARSFPAEPRDPTKCTVCGRGLWLCATHPARDAHACITCQGTNRYCPSCYARERHAWDCSCEWCAELRAEAKRFAYERGR